MARPLRIEYEGAFYHVMNRGNAYQSIFKQPKDYKIFLDLVSESIKLWEIKIHAFTLLTNHYHMLIETPLANLSRAMRHINGVYTQRFNKQHNRDGHIFRGRYKAMLVEDDAYLVELIRYIHRNCLKAGLAKSPEKYEWCSHRNYLGNDSHSWLTTDRILQYFGKRKSKARIKLHEFVMKQAPSELEKRLNGRKWPSVLSSENFEDWVKWNFVKDIDDKNLQYEEYNVRRVAKSKLKKVLCEVLDTNWNQLTKSRTLYEREKRAQAIYYYRQYLKLTYEELSSIFNIKPARISSIVNGGISLDSDLDECIYFATLK